MNHHWECTFIRSPHGCTSAKCPKERKEVANALVIFTPGCVQFSAITSSSNPPPPPPMWPSTVCTGRQCVPRVVSCWSWKPSQSNELNRGPPEVVLHCRFLYSGNSHRRKSAACPKFGCFAAYPSRGQMGYFPCSNYKLFLYLSSLRVEGGGVGTLWCGYQRLIGLLHYVCCQTQKTW